MFNFKEKKIMFFYKENKILLLFKILIKKIILFGKTIFHIQEINSKYFINIFGIKIGNLKEYEINKQEEIKIILNSGFWNADWYIKKYHPEFNKDQALNYWYEKGCWNKELPSKYFNCKYISFCNGLGKNPIIQYLNKSGKTLCFPNDKNPYKSKKDENKIKEYLKYKKTRKARGVVYICITNDYDDIKEIEIYKYIDKNWDYICFTDNKKNIEQKQIGIWEIKSLQFNELDNIRNNRWHKINTHILFPQYEQSIYIDSNINILTSFLFDFIKDNQSQIILPRHCERNCIYDEYNAVLKFHMDNPKLIMEELNLLKKSNMPHNYGLCENNIIYRRHNTPEIINLMKEWWFMISNYSKRDQLSLMYLLWKRKFDIRNITFQNTRLDLYNFYVFAHKK